MMLSSSKYGEPNARWDPQVTSYTEPPRPRTIDALYYLFDFEFVVNIGSIFTTFTTMTTYPRGRHF